MEIHEVANLFPLMSDEEFSDLVADIRENGQREPIWTYQGKIIDGRNRFNACQKLGVKPVTQEWGGKGSLVMFVVSLNLHRRHLSSSQKAALAVDILPMLEEEARQRQIAAQNNNAGRAVSQKIDEQGKGKSTEQAAGLFKTNHSYVSDAKKLKEQAPEKFNDVRKGKKTLTQAKRELKEEKRQKRREENRKKIAAVPEPTKAVEAGAKFSTIVIDPPWDWGDEGDVDQMGRARPDYSTMSLPELLALPVPDLSDTDCHLYLWITNRSLPKGFALLEKWGFRYVTCLTWVKPHFGMGNYFRGQTEHVLFGVKGSQMLKRKDVGTAFQAPRGKQHSSKPIEFYELVESCSPGPYLEMFSRTERKDWTAWGEVLSVAA